MEAVGWAAAAGLVMLVTLGVHVLYHLDDVGFFDMLLHGWYVVRSVVTAAFFVWLIAARMDAFFEVRLR